jgi:GntR family transcriptional repressor for pyruvate dehydrogenase complex
MFPIEAHKLTFAELIMASRAPPGTIDLAPDCLSSNPVLVTRSIDTLSLAGEQRKMDNFGYALSIDRSRVAERIFKDLRDGILLGKIPKGTKLPSERELAQRYEVSGPTVREAIRGLTLLGLADVRHGSGAFVTADLNSLIATSLSAVIQMGKPGVAEVLGVSGVLSEYAASMAASAATREDHLRLRATLVALDQATTAESAAQAVRNYHETIAAAAHNPLLIALCGFLTRVQTELGREFIGNSPDVWRKLFGKLKPLRLAVVEAIINRDRETAVRAAREFHVKAFNLITSLPKAKEVRLTDPKLDLLLSSMMSRIGPA